MDFHFFLELKDTRWFDTQNLKKKLKLIKIAISSNITTQNLIRYQRSCKSNKQVIQPNVLMRVCLGIKTDSKRKFVFSLCFYKVLI